MATAAEHMGADVVAAIRDVDSGAIAVTYAGVPDVFCRVKYGGHSERNSADKSSARVARLRVAKVDVSDPLYLDPVVIDGVEWTMVAVEKENAFSFDLRLERDRKQGWR